MKRLLLIALFWALCGQTSADEDYQIYSKPTQVGWWQHQLNSFPWLRRVTGEEFTFERSVAVVVGISDYAHWDRLASPENDAKRITAFLKDNGFDEIHTIRNSQVTRARLAEIISSISRRLGENDRFFFYWSGHGGLSTRGATNLGYLALSDTTETGKGDPVLMRELQWWALRIPARHKLFLLDTCFSGKAITEGYNAARKIPIGRMSQPIDLILTSSAPDQISFGYRDGTGGIFTSAFLKAVGADTRNYSADYNGDGLITASEIKTEIGNQLFARQAEAGFSQTAVLAPFSGNLQGEYFFVSPNGPAEETPIVQPVENPFQVQPSGKTDTPEVISGQAGDTADFVLDAWTNVARDVGDPIVKIAPEAGPDQRDINAAYRKSILGERMTREQRIVEVALEKMLIRLDPENFYRGTAIQAPAVTGMTIWGARANEAHPNIKKAKDYLASCSAQDAALHFFRTISEFYWTYKTFRTQMFGQHDQQFVGGWGDVVFDDGYAASFGDPLHFPQNVDLLGLDFFLKRGFFADHQDLIFSALDRLSPEWRARIGLTANALTHIHSEIVRADPKQEWQSLPWTEGWRNMQEIDDPFGCAAVPIVVWYASEGQIAEYLYTDIQISEELEKGQYVERGLHETIMNFWLRRRAAGTADQMHRFLQSVADRYEAPPPSARALLALID